MTRGLAFVLAAAGASILSAPAAPAQDGLETDPAVFAAIAEEAYVYGFPMLVAYKVLHDYNVDENSGAYRAPINALATEARVYTPADTAVSTPNSDTPYAFAQLDLRAEPMVVCTPEVDPKRYFDVQLTDQYTYNFGYMGSRTTGNGAACALVAGPGWDGDAPGDLVATFRSETDFAFAIFRTQLFSADDLDAVKQVQAGYSVQPLSAHVGGAAPAPAPAIDWPAPTPAMFGADFRRFLDFVLQFAPEDGLPAEEAALRARMARIGIGAGAPFDVPELSEAQAAALAAGVKAAGAAIARAAENVGTRVNGWQVGAAAGDRAFFDGDWALRAAGAKLGIYGNSAEEATYPFTRQDVNGVPLDGSRHAYALTFPADALPPVKAFWSVTMYDGESQLLVDNPIDRYLVNSPMLETLKRNPDGSITLHISAHSPGPDRESNWLPSPAGPMFVVMRLYWPDPEPPSVLPPGQGAWTPPGIVPVRNLKAERVLRPGDKSLETVVRTDQRYGGDPFFQGPRGWPYWNLLEYPKPIQNPNLWPDKQSTYFISRFALPAGATLTLRGAYPRARYFKFALYREKGGTFVSIGEDLAARDIAPDPGSTNPFVPGNPRLGEPRDYTVGIVARDAPENAADRAPNTLYAGGEGGDLQLVTRLYLSDAGSDGAGWAPAASAVRVRGLPQLELTLPDGVRLSGDAAAARIGRPFAANTAQPLTAAQWTAIVNAKDNDPALDPATAPARPNPRWEKYWNIRHSILGSFKTPEEQAKIAFAGPIDGGGDPDTNYLFVQLSRKFGPVFVTRGRMPTFPDTYAGAAGQGLEVMPEAQTQYLSVVSCEAAPSGQIFDGIADMQIPVDENGDYTIVLSRKEDRPSNATPENGVAWLEWSPRGEGLGTPQNREDFGMLMMRIMAPSEDWAESPANISRPGDEEAVMGAYLPRGAYMTREAFEALGDDP